MFKKSIYVLALAAVLTSVSTPAFAGWVADQDAQSTVERMKSEVACSTITPWMTIAKSAKVSEIIDLLD